MENKGLKILSKREREREREWGERGKWKELMHSSHRLCVCMFAILPFFSILPFPLYEMNV